MPDPPARTIPFIWFGGGRVEGLGFMIEGLWLRVVVKARHVGVARDAR